MNKNSYAIRALSGLTFFGLFLVATDTVLNGDGSFTDLILILALSFTAATLGLVGEPGRYAELPWGRAFLLCGLALAAVLIAKWTNEPDHGDLSTLVLVAAAVQLPRFLIGARPPLTPRTHAVMLAPVGVLVIPLAIALDQPWWGTACILLFEALGLLVAARFATRHERLDDE
jgi:hypothetical protein